MVTFEMTVGNIPLENFLSKNAKSKVSKVIENKFNTQLRTYTVIPNAHTSDFSVGVAPIPESSESERSSIAIHLTVPFADPIVVPHILAMEAARTWDTPKSASRGSPV